MTSRQTVENFERAAHDGIRARRLVADRLDAWGLGAERDAFELVVSELFTNAVRHGAGEVSVRVALDDGVVRVEVADEGGRRPVVRVPDPTGRDPGGWGLRLVGQMTDAWGAEVGEGRTMVWAERAVRR